MGNIEECDVLHGYAEIGAYMRISKDQAKHRARAKEIPTFKLGRIVCARKSSIMAAIAAAERQASFR